VRVEGIADVATSPRQLLLGEPEAGWREAEQAVDRAARRFGAGAVRPAVLVDPLGPAAAAPVATRGRSAPGQGSSGSGQGPAAGPRRRRARAQVLARSPYDTRTCRDGTVTDAAGRGYGGAMPSWDLSRPSGGLRTAGPVGTNALRRGIPDVATGCCCSSP
jgi:hypothetical protein